jgi:hypothetical protein
MVNQEAWTKIVTEPLGLAGFALFLIFIVLGLSRKKSPKKKSLSSPSLFVIVAFTALVGGLLLSYLQNKPVPNGKGGHGGGDTYNFEFTGSGPAVGKNDGVVNMTSTPQSNFDSPDSSATADPALEPRANSE